MFKKLIISNIFSLLLIQVAWAGHPGMVHPPLDISNEKNIPELKITVTKDSGMGWNLYIKTKYFKFTPENTGKQHIPGEGHAHVYVDGQKYARVYGNWFHLPRLQAGKHTIKVTLNANTHSQMHVKTKPIQASQEIEQPKPKTPPAKQKLQMEHLKKIKN